MTRDDRLLKVTSIIPGKASEQAGAQVTRVNEHRPLVCFHAPAALVHPQTSEVMFTQHGKGR